MTEKEDDGNEKPVLIVMPTWDPEEPRFIVGDCPMCGDDRQFKNGKCVFNQRLGLAYSVDEIVEVLNNYGDESDLFKDKIKTAYLNERTELGRSVLKQLAEQLEVLL